MQHSFTKSLLTCLALFAFAGQPLLAQKTLFTYEQLFKGAPTQLTQPLPVVKGWVDDDHYIEYRKNGTEGTGTSYSVEVKTGKATPYTPLGNTSLSPAAAPAGKKEARNFTVSPDQQWAAYTQKDNNLYLTALPADTEKALTADGNADILNGYASWVYYEEILGRASRYKAFWWSPDSKKIAFYRFDEKEVPVFPIYWNDGQHGRIEEQRYPKVGDKNPKVQVGIADVSGTIVWADFNPDEDQYFGTPVWSPGGQLWIPWMNRGQDLLILYAIDPATGQKKEVYRENQKTWIDLDDASRVEFLADGKTFILKSDREGWENLYWHDNSGRLLNPITNGNFWGTTTLKIDEKNKTLYFRARRENSARFDFYRVGLNGKGLTRLSFGDYSHDQILLSPNGKYFITTYSNSNTPVAMALVDQKGIVIRELGNSRGPSFEKYALPKTEHVRVKSSDGRYDLPVQITYPIDFDPAKKYPVWISIYGGPNAGTVYDRWRTPGGTAQWWAQEGLIQVAFDNRSSGHFGKTGLNDIHRQLGKYEIEDYMACGKWLRSQPWTDTNRVGITGGSFGGYITCMALTYGSDVFTHGLANASVTDWQLYDTHYTERFMDTPEENPEGYRLTSVMTYADRYKGMLRIVHGTSDDNVHQQNSIQLVNKLQEARKHFEFMLYPGERHGIGGGSANKAQHIRNETFRFIYTHLLNKPMPGVLSGNTP